MAGVGALVAVLLTVGACGAVDVRRTTVTGADRDACASLVARLPDRLADEGRRETRGNPLGAAWGDPAIVLRCGVGTPQGYDQFSACQTVDGIDWFAPEDQIADQDADLVLTTLGRRPGVEVVVPAGQRPPDAVMVDLADTIRSSTTVTTHCS